MSKWFGAGIIVAIVAAIFAWLFGIPKVQQLERDIQSSLSAAGYNNISVEMDGFTARLSGEIETNEARDSVETLAQTTKCTACWNDGLWHSVDNQISVPDLPLQNPYTFSGIKNASGSVTLSGFVPSQTAKEDIILKGNRIFNTKIVDRTIQIARGAPDGEFVNVVETYMEELALLDKGRFSQEGYDGLISGTSTDITVRNRINQIGASLPSQYAKGFAANIDVPQAAAENVGQVRSETICQTLFNDLKGDNRILFETGRANIKGAASFDLMNKLASAVNQCAAFRVEIVGYTDNVGDTSSNARLSLARAEEVKNYLANQQVEPNRMTTRGLGEANPRASNETEEGRALNRRINFTVTRAQ